MGTYPPRECGIATFNQDLLNSSQEFLGNRFACKVAAMNVSPLDTYNYPPEVEWKLDQNNKREHLALARKINNNSLISGVIIQHEYGIYGGVEGEILLQFMMQCTKPIVVTLHTILPRPSKKMREVTEKIISRANILVVLTQTSKKLLEEVYPISIGKVYVIPHGIHNVDFSSTKTAKRKLKFVDKTILSTFGLLNRGKGIEYVIKALPELIKKYPQLLYLVLGQTHPVVRRNEGEKYRLELSRLVTSLHLKKHVKFYDQYLSLPDLLEFLKATDIYISTSTNPNQAVSGTLSYAMGAGRAVVSTEFAQAKEIITPGTGRLVPIKQSRFIHSALVELLANKAKLQAMHKNAYTVTRKMVWRNVAKEYAYLLEQSTLLPINLSHFKNMTDDFGMFQFAHLSTPNKEFGYTLDDNARALVICSRLLSSGYRDKDVVRMCTIFLDFIETCQLPSGAFNNYLDYANKSPTTQNQKEDLDDAAARAMWSLGEVMSNARIPLSKRIKAKRIFDRALPYCRNVSHLRAKSFMIKGLALTLQFFPKNRKALTLVLHDYADALMLSAKTHSVRSWHWFADHLDYNNALLPESLLIAGKILKNSLLTSMGERTLAFLVRKTFTTNMYIPIGNSHWYTNNEKRSNYDQQPEDPASMVQALSTAFSITHKEKYRNLGNKCFRWFLGNNSLHTPLYNFRTGGCYDGLHPDRVNLNEGAESLVSYLLARMAVTNLGFYEN